MSTREEERRRYATEQLRLLGLKDGDAYYAEALSAAERGFPAWRIAQVYPVKLIEER